MHELNITSKSKLKRIKALIKKEFYQIIRDPSSILIAFIFPLILLFIYGVGVSLDIDNLKVGVVMEDTNSDAQSFMLSMRNSKYFSLTVDRDKEKLQKDLVAGKLRGIVTIPFYFSQYKERHPEKTAPIFVVADGSEPNTANFVQNYVLGVWNTWNIEKGINDGVKNASIINIQPRFWFNDQLDSRYFLIPGSIAIIMTLIGSLLTALVVSREWERGTMEALMTTPVTMRDIYISKIIAYFCLGLISMLICAIVSIFIFEVPFRGSILALMLVSAIFLLTALGIGMLISTLTKNQFLASQISIITAFLPAFMLSGFIFEISSMPLIIRIITYIVPARYMVSSLQTLFLVGNVWELLLFNIGIMSVIGIVFFLIIFTRTVKRLD
jgi:ABC-2 type transport system permease protein